MLWRFMIWLRVMLVRRLTGRALPQGGGRLAALPRHATLARPQSPWFMAIFHRLVVTAARCCGLGSADPGPAVVLRPDT